MITPETTPTSIPTNSATAPRTDIGIGIGISLGFFGVIAFGHRETISIDSTSEEFQLSFYAPSAQTFVVSPGDWYSSSTFELFRDGPFWPDSPIDLARKRGALWGPKGYLNFRPIRYVVAYKPKVKIRLSRHEYHYFHSRAEGAAAFCIGPFVIGAGYAYQEETHCRWVDDTATIELFDAPDRPMLLAVDSRAL